MGVKIRRDDPKTMAALAKLDAMPWAERQALIRSWTTRVLVVTTPQDGLPGPWDAPLPELKG